MINKESQATHANSPLYTSFFTFLMVLLPECSFAGDDTNMGNVLCTTVGWFHGNLAKGLEVLSLMTLGILAMLGKISWTLPIIEAVAVAAMHGAAAIVNSMGAGGTGC